MNPMQSKFEVKGIREGVLITLSEGEWPSLRDALLEYIQNQADFFRGARLALDVGNQILHAAELGQLRDLLSDRGLGLWAVLSNSPTTEQTAQTLGLATRLFKTRPEASPRPAQPEADEGDQAILIKRTLRSGVRVQHVGHVTVIGDVNPGAEIIASGNIVVWGRLRGVVHAGAEGDEEALVCALDLSPTQLRIAGQIATTPKRHSKPQPEMARLRDGHVTAEPWERGGK
jgi:septum site-determining protein MinC